MLAKTWRARYGGIAAFGMGAGRGQREKEEPADPKKKKNDAPGDGGSPAKSDEKLG